MDLGGGGRHHSIPGRWQVILSRGMAWFDIDLNDQSSCLVVNIQGSKGWGQRGKQGDVLRGNTKVQEVVMWLWPQWVAMRMFGKWLNSEGAIEFADEYRLWIRIQGFGVLASRKMVLLFSWIRRWWTEQPWVVRIPGVQSEMSVGEK